MLRRLAIGLGALVGLGLVVGLAVLVPAHVQIRQVAPPLPRVDQLAAAGTGLPADSLPVAVWTLHTAHQAMPRSAVLAQTFDPRPDRPYRMAHPAFAIEWPDGRLFLVDLGMRPEVAVGFGAPIEAISGGAPIEPVQDVARGLGDAVARVAGVGVTHLHQDHVDGVEALCAARGDAEPVPLVRGPGQAERVNFTTRAGRDQLARAACLTPRTLEPGALIPVPDFPGLYLVEGAGHTPGSQWWVARVGRGAEQRVWVWVGDVANHIAGVVENIPKPALYRWLVVPEAPDRLEQLRTLAAGAQARPGVQVLVSHDGGHLAADGPPVWGNAATVDR